MSLWAYKPSIGVCSMLLSACPCSSSAERKIFARKIFSSKCVLFVADELCVHRPTPMLHRQPWAGDVAWEMRKLLPPVQTPSSVFRVEILTVQYLEFSLVHLITFAISTSLAAVS